MTTPRPTEDAIRERFIAALDAAASQPPATRPPLYDAMLAAVQPELDRLRAEAETTQERTEHWEARWRGACERARDATVQQDKLRTELGEARAHLRAARDADDWRRAMVEQARDILEAAGHPRVHADDWPDIIPALTELVAERDGLRAERARYQTAWYFARIRHATLWREYCEEINDLMNHNDQTCEAVAERDRLRATVQRVRELAELDTADDSHAYRDAVDAPLPLTTVAELRERLASGRYPRRRARQEQAEAAEEPQS